MKNLMLGIILGSVLTTGIGFAGSSFYKKDGSVKAPNGSTEQFDYFRLRQSWLDLVATRRATEELARTNQLHPCGK